MPIRRSMDGGLAALTSLVLVLSLPGCVDPFSDKTTTPTKHRAETSGRAGEAAKADGGQAASEKPKKKEPPKQTYKEAWQLICEAEQHAAVKPGATRADRGAAVASWIVNNVTNKKARYWFISFGNAKPQSKYALFAAEVERVGIDPCPLTALLFPADDAPAAAAGEAQPDSGMTDGAQ